MEPQVKVAVTGDKETTLIMRTGEALQLLPPNIVNISGDINTVKNYIKKRRQSDEKEKAEGAVLSMEEKIKYNLQFIHPDVTIIEIDKQAMTISLKVDPQFPYGGTVTGKLEESDELKPFFINKNKEFKKEELVKLLRFSRRFFPDPEKYALLLKEYQVFSAKAYLEMKQEEDLRGNSTRNQTKRVETTLPTEFTMEMPIFKGQGKEKFRIEICLDVTDAGARFWFESVELAEIIDMRVEEIFSEQLKEFTDFVVVNK